MLRDEYSWDDKILDAEYRTEILGKVIKACENLYA
jgi:hypothetical protein